MSTSSPGSLLGPGHPPCRRQPLRLSAAVRAGRPDAAANGGATTTGGTPRRCGRGARASRGWMVRRRLRNSPPGGKIARGVLAPGSVYREVASQSGRGNPCRTAARAAKNERRTEKWPKNPIFVLQNHETVCENSARRRPRPVGGVSGDAPLLRQRQHAGARRRQRTAAQRRAVGGAAEGSRGATARPSYARVRRPLGAQAASSCRRPSCSSPRRRRTSTAWSRSTGRRC